MRKNMEKDADLEDHRRCAQSTRSQEIFRNTFLRGWCVRFCVKERKESTDLCESIYANFNGYVFAYGMEEDRSKQGG
jgi:hypothetical protein